MKLLSEKNDGMKEDSEDMEFVEEEKQWFG